MTAMFNPTKDDVRRFFCEAWRKERAGEVVTPIEALAIARIRAHPEYHALLDDPERALTESFDVARGVSNPFLHLSMHLTLDEQVGIDQPPGIRGVLEALRARLGDDHAAHHAAMEALGRVLWEVQRGVLPADPAAINDAYIEALRRL
jgi:hypothetical protein